MKRLLFEVKTLNTTDLKTLKELEKRGVIKKVLVTNKGCLDRRQF